MKRNFVAFLCGALFAAGLAVSGMAHPSKVLAFLDFAGDWDPSLACVMGGGLLVNLVLFRMALRRPGPLLGGSYSLPMKTALDGRLLAGAAIFGIGWGLGGFCPGPALVSVAGGATPVVAFVVAMLGSMAIFDALQSRLAKGIASGATQRSTTSVEPEV